MSLAEIIEKLCEFANSETDIGANRELIGSLQYAVLATRPDISFAISKLTQFLNNPGQAHFKAATRVLRYLKGTKNWTSISEGALPILPYTDSD